MDLKSLVETLPQLLLYIAISPAVMGMLRWLKARLQGRQGPGMLQPYRDLWKLFHRRAVIPETTSWVFLSAPFIVFGCYLLIGALVPVIYRPSLDQIFKQVDGPPLADFLVIVGLMGLARFALAMAGMDSGSPFGGMGSSREMFIHVLTEPVFIITAYAMALHSNTTSLSGVMSTQADVRMLLPLKGFLIILLPLLNVLKPFFILVFLTLVLVMLAEAGRIPFDNPASHLELGMLGQAVHLEYGGHNLALLEWAEAMRLTFFITLLWNLFFPGWLAALNHSLPVNIFLILLYPVKLFGAVTGLAFWESIQAKRRLRGITAPGGLALSLSILTILLVFVVNYLSF